MDLRPVGQPLPGASGLADLVKAGLRPNLALPEGAAAPDVRIPADTVAVLTGIVRGDVERLLQILDPVPGDSAALLDTLVQHAKAGHGGHAAELVRQVAQMAPGVAEQLPGRQDLAGVRSEIAAALLHLTVTAKADAEHELAAAQERVPDLSQPASPWQSNANVLMDLCEKLIAAGGLSNYKKAERVAVSIFPAGTVIADLPDLPLIRDTRGFRFKAPREFGVLSEGPVFVGILALLVLLVVLWMVWR